MKKGLKEYSRKRVAKKKSHRERSLEGRVGIAEKRLLLRSLFDETKK